MTPLTAMRGYLETLAWPGAVKDDAARTRYLAIVTEETLRLEAIIGDLLDLARLEGGGGTLEHEPVALERLFARAFERHHGLLEERHIALDRRVDPAAATIAGDERRLEQVVQNLVANAVRHTPPGGRIALQAAPGGDGELIIVVEDSGTGIPAEHLAHVFDRFYRVDSARDARSGGSGLGLSIVRAVVERHGGRVSAGTSPLGGARFTVVLPRDRTGAAASIVVSDSGTPP
jgi:signal transduction histidine kinase